MRIYLDYFHSNSDLSIWDVVGDFLARKSDSGLITVFFQTTEKYAYVEADSNLSGLGLTGEFIDIWPIIMDENGKELRETNLDRYMDHKDYYHASIVVETDDEDYVSSVKPTKYEYFVNFIPKNLALYTTGMEPAKMVGFPKRITQ